MQLSVVMAGASSLGETLRGAVDALRVEWESVPLGRVPCGLWTLVIVPDAHLDPEDVGRLWSRRSEADVVLGSRLSRGNSAAGLVPRACYRLVSRSLGLPFRDLESPLFLARTSVLRRLGGSAGTEPAELIVRGYAGGFKLKEVSARSSRRGSGIGLLGRLKRLRQLRRPRTAADSDERAFEQRRWLRRRWLHRRQSFVVGYLEVDVPVVDVGCGSSPIAQILSKGVACDPRLDRLRFLRGRARQVVAGSAARLPFQDGSVPQLACADVLTGDCAPDLAECHRVLRPGGTLVVGALDAASLRWRIVRSLRGLCGPPEAAAPNPRQETEASLRGRLSRAGFALDDLRRVYGAEMVVRAVKIETS